MAVLVVVAQSWRPAREPQLFLMVVLLRERRVAAKELLKLTLLLSFARGFVRLQVMVRRERERGRGGRKAKRVFQWPLTSFFRLRSSICS